jgi:hypothetical protein
MRKLSVLLEMRVLISGCTQIVATPDGCVNPGLHRSAPWTAIAGDMFRNNNSRLSQQRSIRTHAGAQAAQVTGVERQAMPCAVAGNLGQREGRETATLAKCGVVRELALAEPFGR